MAEKLTTSKKIILSIDIWGARSISVHKWSERNHHVYDERSKN